MNEDQMTAMFRLCGMLYKLGIKNAEYVFMFQPDVPYPTKVFKASK